MQYSIAIHFPHEIQTDPSNFILFLIDKRMYIKREEEAPKTVPSKYTGSIQKPAKVALQGGKERNTPPSLT